MDRLNKITPAALGLLLLLGAWACGDDDGESDSGPTITVTSAEDSDARDEGLTLREAIRVANGELATDELTPEEQELVDGEPGAESADIIEFDPAEGQTIALTAPLPPLSGGDDTIAGPGNGGVAVDGSEGQFVCLEIASSGNAVLGLRIQECGTGILVLDPASRNRIGGPAEGEGNTIVGGRVGIEMRGEANIVQGNVIGYDPQAEEADGTEFEGIWMTPASNDNMVGGGAPGEGNVISGNELFGISVDGARSNTIQGNLIGLDPSGQEGVGNKFGIALWRGAFNNLIGGPEPAQANIISASNTGLPVSGEQTTGNTVQGNLFGVNAEQTEEIPNAVDLFQQEGTGENTFEDNLIATELPSP